MRVDHDQRVGDGALSADAHCKVVVVDFAVDVGEAAGEDEVVDRRPFGVDFEAPGLAGVGIDQLHEVAAAADRGQLDIGDFIGEGRRVQAERVAQRRLEAGFVRDDGFRLRN